MISSANSSLFRPSVRIRGGPHRPFGNLRPLDGGIQPVTGSHSVVVASTSTVASNFDSRVSTTDASYSLKLDLHGSSLENVIGLNRDVEATFMDAEGNTAKHTLELRRNLVLEKVTGQPAHEVTLEQLTGPPVAVTLKVLGEEEEAKQLKVFIRNMHLKDAEGDSILFPVLSWIQLDDVAPGRTFFASEAVLPQHAPPAVRAAREREMEIMRGSAADAEKPRKESDRIFDYAPYNDYSASFRHVNDVTVDKSKERPTLGSAALPYPRRLRTGRPLNRDGVTESSTATRDPDTGKPYGTYLPLDQRFLPGKSSGFSRDTISSFVPLLSSNLAVFLSEDPHFADYADYENSVFKEESPLTKLFVKLREAVESVRVGTNLFSKSKEPSPVQRLADFLFASVLVRKAASYPLPRVFKGRPKVWKQDAEFGRQMVAGVNPCDILAMDSTSFPATGTTISEADVEGLLDGRTLAERLEEGGRIFMCDYHDVFKPYLPDVNSEAAGRYMYASRTLLFFNDAGSLVPVAIELSDEESTTVYTPKGNNPQWLLAKTYAVSGMSSYHQLISHWLRCHCAMEPFIIAMHRTISSQHPVYKLLQPHFRYTLDINSRARSTLINAGGFIETSFTPASLSMAWSSIMYGERWRFDLQSLPRDLMSRGMATRNKDGGLELTLKDYPYAADGLLLWDAIEEYVGDYLRVYYSSDADVVEDEEINAWYQEVQEKGHPEKKEGWLPLTGVDNLREILATIIFTASAHHSAVNFGQFDHTGYVPNIPGVTRRAMPSLKEIKRDPEAAHMSIIPEAFTATKMMSVMHILSSHDPDEEYLGEPDHDYIKDEAAVPVMQAFSAAIAAAEKKMEARNRDPTLTIRNGGGPADKFPYTLLHPTSPKSGVTGRGVPTSVSI